MTSFPLQDYELIPTNGDATQGGVGYNIFEAYLRAFLVKAAKDNATILALSILLPTE